MKFQKLYLEISQNITLPQAHVVYLAFDFYCRASQLSLYMYKATSENECRNNVLCNDCGMTNPSFPGGWIPEVALLCIMWASAE